MTLAELKEDIKKIHPGYNEFKAVCLRVGTGTDDLEMFDSYFAQGYEFLGSVSRYNGSGAPFVHFREAWHFAFGSGVYFVKGYFVRN